MSKNVDLSKRSAGLPAGGSLAEIQVRRNTAKYLSQPESRTLYETLDFTAAKSGVTVGGLVRSGSKNPLEYGRRMLTLNILLPIYAYASYPRRAQHGSSSAARPRRGSASPLPTLGKCWKLSNRVISHPDRRFFARERTTPRGVNHGASSITRGEFPTISYTACKMLSHYSFIACMREMQRARSARDVATGDVHLFVFFSTYGKVFSRATKRRNVTGL